MNAKKFSTSQRIVQVMVVLSVLFELRALPAGDSLQWQPWVCPPLFVEDTKHETLLSGLHRVLPFSFLDPDSVAKMSDGVFLFMFCCCFDFASSNVSAVGKLVALLHGLKESASRFAIHPERCLTHQLHIVKSASMGLANTASMLYCLSAIIRNYRSVQGLADAIRAKVRASFTVRVADKPPHDELLDRIKQILNADGDASLMYCGSHGQRKKASWFTDVEAMVAACHWDSNTKQWVHFVEAAEGQHLLDIDRDAASDVIADHLIKVLIRRRWETAAASRWTGVLSCLKRMLLGVIMGGIPPQSLAGLSSSMHITEGKVAKLLRGGRGSSSWRRGQQRVRQGLLSCLEDIEVL